jgi:ABC-type multidrug transport system fused ATPase/permease subunit
MGESLLRSHLICILTNSGAQFGIALLVLIPMFLFAASYYRSSAREIKRHETLQRSLVFTRFSEALSGTACIRAYGLANRFITGIRRDIDGMNGAYFLTFSNQRWLSIRLDCISNLRK